MLVQELCGRAVLLKMALAASWGSCMKWITSVLSRLGFFFMELCQLLKCVWLSVLKIQRY